jgi:hypothetical protein
MIMRKRGALLFGGWRLMQPPNFPIERPVDVSSWDQKSAHDSVADCERARAALKTAAESVLDESGQRNAEARKRGEPRELTLRSELALVQAVARCVPAEHVYSPKKETR